jgi:hypothetical protein
MNKVWYGILGTLVILSLTVVSFAGDGTGTDPNPASKMYGGVRALGMGNSFTGVADDASAGFYNPAGLTQLEGSDLNFFYSTLGDDKSLNVLNYAQILGDMGAIGITWMNNGVDDIKITDDSTQIGTDDYSQDTIILSWGNAITDYFAYGVNGKVFFKDVVGETEDGLGLDLALFAVPADDLTVGMTLQDVAGDIGDDDLATKLKLGLGYRPFEGWLFAADFGKDLDENTTRLSVGAEWVIDWQFALRAGTQYIDGDADGDEADRNVLTLGAGYTHPFDSFDLKVDLAYSTEDHDLDTDALVYSLGVRF